MGYLDAMISGAFRTSQDGKKLFFACPFLRGYIIPTEEEFQKLTSRMKIYQGVVPPVLAAVLAALIASGLVMSWVAIVIPLMLVVPYWLWIIRFCRRFPRSTERFSYKESFASQARASSYTLLWISEIIDLAACGYSFQMLLTDAEHRGLGFFATVFFGIAAGVVAMTIAVKNRINKGIE